MDRHACLDNRSTLDAQRLLSQTILTSIYTTVGRNKLVYTYPTFLLYFEESELEMNQLWINLRLHRAAPVPPAIDCVNKMTRIRTASRWNNTHRHVNQRCCFGYNRDSIMTSAETNWILFTTIIKKTMAQTWNLSLNSLM